MRHLLSTLICITLFVSCTGKKENTTKSAGKTNEKEQKTFLSYAEGFSVRYEKGAKWVTIPRPFQGAKNGLTYLLVQKGEPIPEHSNDTQVVEVPIENLVCTSTTHIPLLDYLNETEALSAFPTTDYISSTAMRQRIDSGHVADLGVDSEMNLELLLDENPDMVMTYTIGGDFGQFRQMQQAGIPVVVNAEYLETHPLGRAEWIKFMALFFNKEKMADSIFSTIATNYNKLKSRAETSSEKPTVLSGVVYGDTWYMPGGKNYASTIINDASAEYMWASDTTSGFLELSFESVYDEAHAADYWIGVGSYKTLEAMRDSDSRYATFEAFKTENIYTYDARKGAKGGSEFLELGYLRPDLILEDLIKILHPGLLGDKELYFHAKLR